MTIPSFNSNGLLPPGVHNASWQEFEQFFGFSYKRKTLLHGLKRAAIDLRIAGGKTLFIDGSFVTQKRNPGDYDACYLINELDPVLLNPVFLNFSDQRKKQKLKYQGEFFPSHQPADQFGTRFIDFFQKDKSTKELKGIISLDIGVLP